MFNAGSHNGDESLQRARTTTATSTFLSIIAHLGALNYGLNTGASCLPSGQEPNQASASSGGFS